MELHRPLTAEHGSLLMESLMRCGARPYRSHADPAEIKGFAKSLLSKQAADLRTRYAPLLLFHQSQKEEVAKKTHSESAIFAAGDGGGGVLLHSPKLHFQRWPPHRGCVLRAAFQGVTAHPDGSPPRSWLTVYNLISPDDCTEKATMMTMMKGEDPLGSELQSVGNRFFVGSCHPFQLSLRVMRSVKRFVFFFLSHHPTHAAVGQICKTHTFIFGPLPIILRVTEYFKKQYFSLSFTS